VVGYNLGSVRNSYATGSVRGQRAAGGVVGLNAESNENNGQIYNCVALNPSVSSATTSTSDIGRIMGAPGPNVSRNHARETMVIRYDTDNGGTPKATTSDVSGADGRDLSEEAALSAAFWSTLPWEHTVWEVTDGSLPILRNVGGTQNPVLK